MPLVSLSQINFMSIIILDVSAISPAPNSRLCSALYLINFDAQVIFAIDDHYLLIRIFIIHWNTQALTTNWTINYTFDNRRVFHDYFYYITRNNTVTIAPQELKLITAV